MVFLLILLPLLFLKGEISHEDPSHDSVLGIGGLLPLTKVIVIQYLIVRSSVTVVTRCASTDLHEGQNWKVKAFFNTFK